MQDWMLTVEEVLKHPLFEGAMVVAGTGGLSRSIRWVHILETAENASALNGRELILATGIDLGNDAQKLINYLEQLIKYQASGLCLRLGHYVSQIPPEALNIADKLNFPLVALKDPVRFVDITLDLHETMINRHLQVLVKLDEYSRKLQKLTLQRQNLSRILSHLHETIHTEVMFLASDGLFLSAPNMPQLRQTKMTESLKSVFFANEGTPQTRGVLKVENDKEIMYQPVAAMGQVLAFLAVSKINQSQDDLLGFLLDYTASATAQILLRGVFIQERALENEGRILEDILQNRITHEDEIHRLFGIKNSLQAPYWAMVIEPSTKLTSYTEETSSTYRDLFVVFRSIASQHGLRTVLLTRGNQLYILLISTNITKEWHGRLEKVIQNFRDTCFQTFGSDFSSRLGISRPYQYYADIKFAFQEAEQALSLSPFAKSPFFGDLGVFRLLAEIKNTQVLTNCIDDYLGPILRYDKEHGTELLLTLRSYLNHNLSKQETADELFIHRQTLYHRLDKLEELLGHSYTLPDHRLCLELAFRAYDWLNYQDS